MDHAPRRNNLILKWDSQRKPGQSETRPRVAAATVTQLVNDYANVRPGPTTLPQSLKGRDKFIRSSIGSSQGGAATQSSMHNQPHNDKMYVGSLANERQSTEVRGSLN